MQPTESGLDLVARASSGTFLACLAGDELVIQAGRLRASYRMRRPETVELMRAVAGGDLAMEGHGQGSVKARRAVEAPG